MALQRIPTDAGVMYNFGDKNQFERPAWPDAMEASEPANFLEYAADALGSYMDAMEAISNDKRISDFGKAERLTPKSAEVLEVMARTSGALDKYDADRDAEEAALLAVPRLGPGEGAEAVIDSEVRSWWRLMDRSARASTLSKLMGGPAEHQRITLALLRSPTAALDNDMLALREAWNDFQRRQSPQKVEALEVARQTSEISRRALAHVAGRTATLVRWEKPQMLDALLGVNNEFTKRGAKVFGFNDADVAAATRRAEARQRQAIFGH